ncbi:heme exporter protein CcmD [Xanthobacter variabilis]|uniref:heme exporter protein CcmD n=1 Tax=Xanthobacter variabilis TaxID=3119932 RepID=UPI00374F673D
MSHLLFIAASYGVSLLGLGLLTGWILLSYRREQRMLRELEARGLRRRARAAAPARTATESDTVVRVK